MDRLLSVPSRTTEVRPKLMVPSTRSALQASVVAVGSWVSQSRVLFR